MRKTKKFFGKFIKKGNNTLIIDTQDDTVGIFYEFAIFPLTLFKSNLGFLTLFNLFDQLFVCLCQFFRSFIDLLFKMLLIFFQLRNIFENYCKPLTPLIKNNGYQFDLKKIFLTVNLKTVRGDMFNSIDGFPDGVQIFFG